MAIVETSFLSESTSKHQRTIQLPSGKEHLVKPNQIIVWLSITPKVPARGTPPADSPVFPAILDTGCGTCLYMTEEQFDYARRPHDDGYCHLRQTTVNGEPADIIMADAWLYRQSSPAHIGTFNLKNPVRLSLREGVRVRVAGSKSKEMPPKAWFARGRRNPEVAWSQPLPTLGLEVFPVNCLALQMEGFARKVKILLQPRGHSLPEPTDRV